MKEINSFNVNKNAMIEEIDLYHTPHSALSFQNEKKTNNFFLAST
jgi:hypothetical protein